MVFQSHRATIPACVVKGTAKVRVLLKNEKARKVFFKNKACSELGLGCGEVFSIENTGVPAEGGGIVGGKELPLAIG